MNADWEQYDMYFDMWIEDGKPDYLDNYICKKRGYGFVGIEYRDFMDWARQSEKVQLMN